MASSKVKNEGPEIHLIAILEILKSGYWYDRQMQTVLKPFGLSHEQFNVLRILEHNQARKFSLKEIQARLMNKTANTTRLVEKLRMKGYVKSKYSETNRRTLEISITREGLKLMKSVSGPVLELGRSTTEALNDKDAEKLVRILRKFRKASKKRDQV